MVGNELITKVHPKVRAAIMEAEPVEPEILAEELTKKLNVRVTANMVTSVRGSLKRAENISRAKDAASESLEENLAIMADTKNKLQDIFNDPTVAMKTRIDAAKELRQWVQLENTASGIEDEESGLLFVVEKEWTSV